MKSSGVARGMTIDEAMKVLNMKRFNSQELNEKFRFRVQSVAQGLGGSLEVQKSIYTAWEYLNRMLARRWIYQVLLTEHMGDGVPQTDQLQESSTHTEHLLRSADKTEQMNEKPKRLDMIPIKLSNPTRKVSVIIEKKDKARKTERQVKSILKVNDQELVRTLPPIHSTKSLDNADTLNSVPGAKAIKRVRWNEKMNITYSDSNSNKGQSKKRYRRLNLRSAPSKRKMFAEKENTVLQLKEGTGKATSSVEDDSADERKGSGKTLGRLMDELPKLLNLQTIPFKRVPVLNEIYANPKRLSKHDQKSAALRMLWREESEQILKDSLPDKAKRKHTAHFGGKTRTNSGNLMRKSLQKQEEVLYRKFKLDTFPTISDMADRPTRGLPQEQRTLNRNIKQASKGLYTPSRIKSWMESSEELNPE